LRGWAALLAVGAGLWATVLVGPALAAPASTSTLSASTSSSTTAPSDNSGLLLTPLLSPARLPRTLQVLGARDAVSGALTAVLASPALATARATSCVEAEQGGAVLYASNASLPVTPASNMKLLTATSLLDVLGPNYTFTTTVKADRAPVKGVIQGNLYLVGGGDPLLRLDRFAKGIVGGDPVYTSVDQLVAKVKAAGVTHITGAVVGDESRYDTERTVAGWPARYVAEGDVGALSALGIDDGFATAGAPVPIGAAPPVQSAGLVEAMLKKAGVKIDGGATSGVAPGTAALVASITSPTLAAELGEVLRESDDTATELLVKELAAHAGEKGTTAAGLPIVRRDLAGDGLPLDGFVADDGSGLSRNDRVTCGLVLAVLQRSGASGLLADALPVAAKSGTLQDRMAHTPAAGRVEAKTGTLNGVSALSGWVQPVPGQGEGNLVLAPPVAFAAVLNGIANDTVGINVTDDVAVALAEYPTVLPLSRYGPGG
jgi:D-alanyl-D-alanine carboxypeptidase/D-alanyl-D-alanine-endopeptidase (penicillin-binding protein 4)